MAADVAPVVRVHPATPDRWDDLRALLSPRGEGADACWCLAWRLPSGEFGRMAGPDREDRLRELVAAEPPPGLLAYVDDEPAGWCNVGPRTAMERLVRSTTIHAVDDLPVWSVVCFVVRTGYRRQGLAEELLHGAVEFAGAHGAPALEGYPVETGGARLSTALAYVGTTGMFERAGFRRVAGTDATSARRPRWVMRHDLAGAPGA
ncbi:GNAT family N-acetyltransferase [Jiangella mangrovi]|uniref:GNAT superfamily N-acetyltransferase n=1 Tax=Jiangella mangrovi TaxID=1524084 RepID=A0A7W9GUC4_9ACTN|nr:GNAT family N-acetyltransferase [Jiangella mangrovi]MBB5789954.1 GNAT superfamily N-acetyltransferase [Jiangella mangrovi]